MKITAASNKLLDVRREQRLSYHVVFLLLACVLPVPPHVNAAVNLSKNYQNILQKNLIFPVPRCVGFDIFLEMLNLMPKLINNQFAENFNIVLPKPTAQPVFELVKNIFSSA